jgi:outer membrane receptor protein involved in Fe transport
VTYEKYGFFFRVAGTFRSDYLDALGEVASEDRYMDDHFQVDISSSYRITDNFTVFGNIVNINDEPLRAYFDKSNRLSQYEEYGWSAMVGFKWNL